MKKVHVILASKSPRRADLLRKIGVDFTVELSDFKEIEKKRASKKEVAELVIENAFGKAASVAEHVSDGVILGVDTLIWTGGNIFGKPKDRDHAVSMLKELTTNPHFVFTGIVLIKKEKGKKTIVKDFDVVKLYPQATSPEFIEEYVVSGEPFDKAGGYSLERKGILFFRRIEGDSSTVLGLPIASLIKLADRINIKIV